MAASRKRGRGEGSIQKRADGTWRATISLGTGPDGKRRRKDLYGKTRTEVQKKLREAQSAHDAGKLPTTAKTTVADYLAFWLDNIVKVKSSTRLSYRYLIRDFVTPIVGKTKLTQLTPLQIDRVISSCGKGSSATSTQRNVFAVLRKSLNDAVRRDLIAGNPCMKCDAPKIPKSQHKIWTAEQTRRFLEQSKKHRMFALFALAAYTAMRQGESLAMFWSDIDWERNKITIMRTLTDTDAGAVVGDDAKTVTGQRTIHLPTCVMEALDQHRAKMAMDGHPTSGRALVFVSHEGKIIRRRDLTQVTFKAQCLRVGVPMITWHQIRHSGATMLLESGVPIGNVAKQLGHSSSVVTAMVYSHVTEAGMDRVANVMDSLLERKPPEAVLSENGGANGGI
jgi:integrase